MPSQTNSALLANTLALDKLNEHDGVEVRRGGALGLGYWTQALLPRVVPRRSAGQAPASQPLPSGVPAGP